MASPFQSFGSTRKHKTADEMAVELVTDACERYAVLRAEATQREKDAEPPAEWTVEAQECMTTIDALLRGRHRRAVLPIVIRFFPEILTPATASEAELAAAMQATANQEPS